MPTTSPMFQVDLGQPVPLRWLMDRAILCVYVYPAGAGLQRAVWQLESDVGAKFAVVFADPIGGTHYPDDGQAVTTALQAMPGFDSEAFAAARAAVEAPANGRFVCWQRTPASNV